MIKEKKNSWEFRRALALFSLPSFSFHSSETLIENKETSILNKILLILPHFHPCPLQYGNITYMLHYTLRYITKDVEMILLKIPLFVSIMDLII